MHPRSIYMLKKKKVQADNVWGKRCAAKRGKRTRVCHSRQFVRGVEPTACEYSFSSPEIARIFVLIRSSVTIRSNVYIALTQNPEGHAIYTCAVRATARDDIYVRACACVRCVCGRNHAEPRAEVCTVPDKHCNPVTLRLRGLSATGVTVGARNEKRRNERNTRTCMRTHTL